MNEISDKDIVASSDTALMETLGSFIKYHRLQQNKTQDQLATETGIARSTLSLFERGQNTSLLVFIQLLRALKLLSLLQGFRVKQQISPLELARLEQEKKKRARQTGAKGKKTKSTW
jgi:transcriptional regulator with XRE-family HTH domain